MTTHIDPGEPGGFERRLLAELAVIDKRRQPAIPKAAAPVRTPAPHRGSKRPRLRRALSVVAVLAALLALTTAAVATLYNPATFEPDGQAVAGDPYPVKGSGCRESSTVVFTLDDRITLGATTAIGEGIFVAEPRIPAETTPGPHDLTASCPDDRGKRMVQHAKLMVVTSVPLEAPGLWGDSAVAGGPAVVKGAGCQEGGEVAFALDDTIALGVTLARRGGVFFAELNIPATTTLGAHDVAAACTDNHGKRLVQHAKLVVVKAAPRLGPSFSAVGDAVAGDPYRVKGSGCRAGSTVVVTLDDRTRLGVTMANRDGVFSAEPRIPADTRPGYHDLAASCSDDRGEDLVQHAELMAVKR